ncbi:tripartite tricarboxylate transporter TctB family protein [Halomonas sp. V046]|uniref:tripartite tricarboxylate transporter TctB family protein n=1 Tax=Halomonas sp. V046 TaxID=3459611 RepID=UPI0040442BE9
MRVFNVFRLSAKDLVSGLMMVTIGLLVSWEAASYRLGSASQMGAGYYPMLLGVALVLLGVGILATGCRSGVDDDSGPVSGSRRRIDFGRLRSAVLVPLSIVLFGALLEPAGLIPACLALVIVSSLAAPSFRLRRLVGLCLGVPVLVVLIFVVGLGLPFTLVGG